MQIRQADVVLVQMPQTWLNPSLALGLLKADLNREGISNETIYASHHYIDFIGYDLYKEAVIHLDYIRNAWEMLFAPMTDFTPMESALSVIKKICDKQGVMYAGNRNTFSSAELFEKIEEMWPKLLEVSEAFIEYEAKLILERKPKIVGCSVMTQQRNASFALCKKLKELDPDIVTIIGGGCCTGETGPAYVSTVPSLDYVFSGEGDGALGKGCALIMAGKRGELLKTHPEFLVPGAPPVNRAIEDLNTVPIPDYSDFFEQIKEDDFENGDSSIIVMESSRGCWWGQKHRCRFCGLHSCEESLRFRKKTDERIWSEIKHLRDTYGISEFYFSDCILDMEFIRRLPLDPPDDRKGIKILVECKSNLKDIHMRALKVNGFIRVQPGIESLSDDILKLMSKGAAVIDQLACLKYARKYGVRLYWNILFGIPNEKKEWYDDMLSLMSHIRHFQPPTSVQNMMLVRNSVFLEEHDRFGLHTINTQIHERACDPNPDFTEKTALIFESPEMVTVTGIEALLMKEVDQWWRDFETGKNLIYVRYDDCTVVRDTRGGGMKKVFRFKGAEREILDLTAETASENKLLENLSQRYEEKEIRQALELLERNWIIYRKKGRILSLALPEERWSYGTGVTLESRI